MSLAGKAIEIVSFPASESYQKDVRVGAVDALKVLRTHTPYPFVVFSFTCTTRCMSADRALASGLV